ncbi:MAG: tRNA (adenine(22)-N(1))-methyltransferase TrmK [Candidatus Andersenbacteria bacterium]|nr:tRNA (adenine(22)-N(1))-methyltransferase TrmK [Candidatus Andersenbacteria bacterium]MBI3250843.1 tRNA (adenine(22)-N(1))-methyltransferase TrmK [Candidatus Andersenbacteria bacterium]
MTRQPDMNRYRRLVYQDYRAGTKQILRDSQEEKWPYWVGVLGKKFIVYRNVFSPKYFNDTEFFARELPIMPGENVLEIGCGTGVIAIFAKHKGANKVVAADINLAAVKNTKENVRLHKMEDEINVRAGDVYEAIGENEKFDVIFWNIPFGFTENKKISNLEKSINDPGYKAVERFIKEGKNYLKNGGRLLIGFSTTLGKFELIQKFVAEANMSLRLLEETEPTELHPVKFEIFEVTPKQ